jgi:hypothetical protein
VLKNLPLILTIFSIAASLCLLGVLMAIFQAFYLSEGAPEQALRLVTRNKVSLAVTLPQFYRDKIKSIPGVHEVMIANWFGGTYIDDKPEHQFARFATEPDKIFIIRPEMKIGDGEKKGSPDRQGTRRQAPHQIGRPHDAGRRYLPRQLRFYGTRHLRRAHR